MGKFKSLVSNTVIFAFATFSSKLLLIALMPLLTMVLSPGEYGMAKNVINTANLILPVMYLCIAEAVIRFGIDTKVSRRSLFTAGILTVLGGFVVLQIILSFVFKIEFMKTAAAGYETIVRFYVLASAVRTFVTHFVRASGFVRIFALDGLFTTVTTLVLVYVFLIHLELGGPGYMLATVCADILSSLTLILLLKLYRFFKIRKIDFTLWKTMLAYSIPLVPTAVMWWVTNLSDRYFVTNICGIEINGLYDASTMIPTAITLVSAIFIQAWQISAFSEQNEEERSRFYTTVFRCYYTFVFLAASGIIMLVRPMTKILMAEQYFEAWKFTPFLVLAVSFSSFVTFLGTVYNTAKKNAMLTITTTFGAVLNILLNWLLIPQYGAQGASIATFISFAAVFIIRAVDCRRYIKINMQPVRFALNVVLIIVQIWLSLTEPVFGSLWQILIFVLLLVCNIGNVAFIAKRFWSLLAGKLPFLARR